MSTTASPFISLQCDWEEVLRETEGQAWVTCQVSGQTGHHGDLRSLGLSSDGIPYVTPSEGFRLGTITKKIIEVYHDDPNCRCKFFAPIATFKNIHLKSVVCMDVTPGGLGVSACTQNKLTIWETKKGIIRRHLEGHLGDVYTCRFFPSGVVVLSGGADMQLKIWSAETGQCPVTMKGHTGAILDTAVVDKGRNVISVSRDGTAKLWDCGKSSCLDNIASVGAAINCCTISDSAQQTNLGQSDHAASEREIGTEHKLLLLACEDKHLRGYSVCSRKEVFCYPCSSAVNSCTYLNDRLVVCGMQDGTLNTMDIRNTRAPIQSWLHSSSAVCSLLPHKDGFFAGKNDGTCMYYQVTNTDNFLQLTGSDCDPIYKVVSDKQFIYTSCRDGTIRKYNLS